ncbi:hypothetical protein C8J56DRAFT_905476 [Mycena floridula]|nr:hypothetical protein C8J56DRAFT_905476 [Mycena floridula]
MSQVLLISLTCCVATVSTKEKTDPNTRIRRSLQATSMHCQPNEFTSCTMLEFFDFAEKQTTQMLVENQPPEEIHKKGPMAGNIFLGVGWTFAQAERQQDMPAYLYPSCLREVTTALSKAAAWIMMTLLVESMFGVDTMTNFKAILEREAVGVSACDGFHRSWSTRQERSSIGQSELGCKQ